jgi:alkylated DNA repair protein (DNA oxidative demethylase)
MIGKIGEIRPEFQAALLEEILSTRGDMPLVTKRMPRSGREFNYKCFSLGRFGWYSDQTRGYRYTTEHPETQQKWPSIPPLLQTLIEESKFLISLNEKKLGEIISGESFAPDSVLCNIYQPGDSLGVHIDSTEKNRIAPILSLSLGLPAKFVFGPDKRCQYKTIIHSGDIYVMAGPHRNWWHGIPQILLEKTPLGIDYRLNLTIRQNLFDRQDGVMNKNADHIIPENSPPELPENVPRVYTKTPSKTIKKNGGNSYQLKLM